MCYRIVRHQDRIRGSFPGGKGIASYRPIFLIYSPSVSRLRTTGAEPAGAAPWVLLSTGRGVSIPDTFFLIQRFSAQVAAEISRIYDCITGILL